MRNLSGGRMIAVRLLIVGRGVSGARTSIADGVRVVDGRTIVVTRKKGT